MSSIVYVKSKDGKRTYVYESTSYWDKEKKAPRSKRKLLGRLGENGEIVPTRPRKKAEVPQDTEGVNYQAIIEARDMEIDSLKQQVAILQAKLKHANEQNTKLLQQTEGVLEQLEKVIRNNSRVSS